MKDNAYKVLDQWTDRSAGPDACWPFTKSSYRIYATSWRMSPREMSEARRQQDKVNRYYSPHVLVAERALGRKLTRLEVVQRSCDTDAFNRCVNPAHITVTRRAQQRKLTDTDRQAIRTRVATGEETNRKIAADYDVSPMTITRVVREQ